MVDEFLSRFVERHAGTFTGTTESGLHVKMILASFTDKVSIVYAHIYEAWESQSDDCTFELMGLVANSNKNNTLYLFKSPMIEKIFSANERTVLRNHPKVTFLDFSFHSVLEYVRQAVWEKKPTFFKEKLPDALSTADVSDDVLNADVRRNILNDDLDVELATRFVREMEAHYTTSTSSGFFTPHCNDLSSVTTWEGKLAGLVFDSLVGNKALQCNLSQSKEAYKARLKDAIADKRSFDKDVAPYADIPKAIKGYDIFTIDFIDKNGKWHSINVNNRAFERNAGSYFFMNGAFCMPISDVHADEQKFNLIKNEIWSNEDGVTCGGFPDSKIEYRIPWENILSIYDGKKLLWHNTEPEKENVNLDFWM